MFILIRKKTLEEYKIRIKELEDKVVEQYERISEYDVKLMELSKRFSELEKEMKNNRHNYVVETCKLKNRIKELEGRLK